MSTIDTPMTWERASDLFQMYVDEHQLRFVSSSTPGGRTAQFITVLHVDKNPANDIWLIIQDGQVVNMHDAWSHHDRSLRDHQRIGTRSA